MMNPFPKISKTTSGAEIVGSIGDLLIQIFAHLPLKPLIRFKSVSKHWNSIISDPKFQFTCNQVRNSPPVGLIFQNSDMSRLDSFDGSSNKLPQIHIPYPLRIFHSCNGLLVLKSTETRKHYYVYNPTTGQKTPSLLKNVNARPRDSVLGMYLAYDPSELSHHYKVVCVWQLDCMTNDMLQYQFDVYSSETGSWENRGGWFRDKVDFNNGVYWKGAIHWLSLKGESIYFNPDHDETPRVMPSPPVHPGRNYLSRGFYFGESFDHLHCAVVGVPIPGYIVYEMRRDYSEWFVKYRVDDYSQCLLRNYTIRNLYSVVRGTRDEDSLLVLGTDKGEIICYNLVHNTTQTIEVKDVNFAKPFQYVESFCSV